MGEWSAVDCQLSVVRRQRPLQISLYTQIWLAQSEALRFLIIKAVLCANPRIMARF